MKRDLREALYILDILELLDSIFQYAYSLWTFRQQTTGI